MDRTGRHTARELDLPGNMTPLFLRAYSPELNALGIMRRWDSSAELDDSAKCGLLDVVDENHPAQQWSAVPY